MLLLFPGDFNLAQNIFASVIYVSVVFFVLGLVISYMAGQIATSLFWILSFAFFALFRTGFHMEAYIAEISVLFSSSLLLFSFNMITDPSTSPKTAGGNFFFGFAIAAIDAICRVKFIPYGNFYALFIVSSLMPILRHRKTQEEIIKG